MNTRHDLRQGTPCWVDTLQPDPESATPFYEGLFDWSFDPPHPMPGGQEGQYQSARFRGHRVAGLGQAARGAPAVWTMYVSTEEADETLARAEQLGGKRVTDPMDAGVRGRIAVLEDPMGVTFGIQGSHAHGAVGLTGQPGTWAMSSLHTSDVARSAEFYGVLFGWELNQDPATPVAEFRLADEVIAVASSTEGTGVPPHWAISLAVGDADSVTDRAIALGGTVLVPPVDTPGHRSAVIADPQGGVVAITATRH